MATQVTYSPLRNRQDFTYIAPDGKYTGTFRIYFGGMDKILADKVGDVSAEAKKIVSAELRKLNPFITDIYKSYAPYQANKSPKALSPVYLRDTIQAQVVNNTMQVRMAAWGAVTTEGRRGFKSMKPIPIILPDGSVIFRHSVGRATTRAVDAPLGSDLDIPAGNERMRWAQHAYAQVKYQKILDTVGNIIAHRIAAFITNVEAGDDGLTARRQARATPESRQEFAQRGEKIRKVAARKRKEKAPRKERGARVEGTRRSKKQVDATIARHDMELSKLGVFSRTKAGMKRELQHRQDVTSAKIDELSKRRFKYLPGSKERADIERSILVQNNILNRLFEQEEIHFPL